MGVVEGQPFFPALPCHVGRPQQSDTPASLSPHLVVGDNAVPTASLGGVEPSKGSPPKDLFPPGLLSTLGGSVGLTALPAHTVSGGLPQV